MKKIIVYILIITSIFTSILFISCESNSANDSTSNSVKATEITSTGAVRNYYIALTLESTSAELKDYKLTLQKSSENQPAAADITSATSGVFSRNIPAKGDAIHVLLFTTLKSGLTSTVITTGTQLTKTASGAANTIQYLLEPGTKYTLYGLPSATDSAVQNLGNFSTSPYAESDFTSTETDAVPAFLDKTVAGKSYTVRSGEPVFIPGAFNGGQSTLITAPFTRVAQTGSGASATWSIPTNQPMALYFAPTSNLAPGGNLIENHKTFGPPLVYTVLENYPATYAPITGTPESIKASPALIPQDQSTINTNVHLLATWSTAPATDIAILRILSYPPTSATVNANADPTTRNVVIAQGQQLNLKFEK